MMFWVKKLNNTTLEKSWKELSNGVVFGNINGNYYHQKKIKTSFKHGNLLKNLKYLWYDIQYWKNL